MSDRKSMWRGLGLAALMMGLVAGPGTALPLSGQTTGGVTESKRPVITRDFFGINGVTYLHYRNSPEATATAERRMALMKRIGVATDRGDLWWSVVETERGRWDWRHTDWLFDFFQRHQTGFLPILAYNEAGAKHSPASPEEWKRFADYARRAVERYKDRGVAVGWEVWNEPNIPTFWQPAPDADKYAALLKETYRAIKQADPRTTVVGGAINMADVNFLEELARRGALDAMDVLSFHPYSLADGPEQMHLQRQIRNFRTVLARHGKARLPVWITEIGWHSNPARPETVAKAAACLVQTHVIAAAEGIERLFWFNVQDWEENDHREAWGFLTPDGEVKRSADAYRTLVDHLTGARFEGYLDLPGAAVFVFSTEEDRETSPALSGSGSLAVAWATGETTGGVAPQLPVAVTKLELPMTDEMLRRLQPPVITTVFGDPLPPTSSHLSLTTRPVYVRLQGGNLFTGLVPERREPENLLTNGSLDRGDEGTTRPYGWDRGLFYGGQNEGRYGWTSRDGAAERTTGTTAGSAKAVEPRGSGERKHPDRVVTLAETRHAVWQSWPVPCLPGERFTATARIKARGATGTNGIQLQFFTGPGWGLADSPSSESITGTTETSVTVTGTCPPGSCWVRVNLLSRDNSGEVAFDDVELRRVSRD